MKKELPLLACYLFDPGAIRSGAFRAENDAIRHPELPLNVTLSSRTAELPVYRAGTQILPWFKLFRCLFDSQFFELVAQCPKCDAKQFSRCRLVTIGFDQCLFNRAPFHLLQIIFERAALA